MSTDQIYKEAMDAAITPAIRQAKALVTLADEIEKLRKQRDLLAKALAFYADPASWKPRGHPQIDADTAPIIQDQGKIAREALK